MRVLIAHIAAATTCAAIVIPGILWVAALVELPDEYKVFLVAIVTLTATTVGDIVFAALRSHRGEE